MADESVVVIKARPVKPSNGVEEKTELTTRPVEWGMVCQKQVMLRREEVNFNSMMNSCRLLVVYQSNRYRGLPTGLLLESSGSVEKPYRGVDQSTGVDCQVLERYMTGSK